MQNGFTSFADALSFAVMREEESYAFYKKLAEQTTDPFLQTLFNNFAKEELRHKQVLLDIDAEALEKIFSKIIEKQDDLKATKDTKTAAPGPESTFGDNLILAMNRENKAFELYSLLSEISEDEDLSILFLGLAKEEEQHRIKIEETYHSLFGK